MQTIKPADNQIFARPDKAEAKTSSGFYLTDKAQDQPHTATIINVGGEVKKYSPDNVIVYNRYAAKPINLNGEEFIIISEQDVLGEVLEVNNG